MFDIVCVSNRRLCNEDFILRMEKIAEAHPKAVILREKDMSENEYFGLAEKLIPIFRKSGTPLIFHSFCGIAKKLRADSIHLPLHILRELPESDKKQFRTIGCSCHSPEEAEEAQSLGASYITAGHVFSTDCKKGLPPRGLDFLSEICRRVNIPVFAIGGISPENISLVRSAGAAGACIMSSLMTCNEPAELLSAFEKE